MTSPITNLSYPTVCTWMGRNIEELSKEELINAVKQLGREIEVERNAHLRTIDMWASFREAGAR